MGELRAKASHDRSFLLKADPPKRILLDATGRGLWTHTLPEGAIKAQAPAIIDALIARVEDSTMDPVYKRWFLWNLRDARRTGDRGMKVRRRFREQQVIGRLFFVDLIARGAPANEVGFAATVMAETGLP